MSTPEPDPRHAPSDHTTLSALVADYEAAGFTGQFEVDPEASVRCATCGAVSAASSVPMYSLRRVEGASDPADMAAVVALSCPQCDARGTVVLTYGPAASPEDGDVLGAFRDFRHDGVAPPSASPGEHDHTA
jgi:hypothetical protein